MSGCPSEYCTVAVWLSGCKVEKHNTDQGLLELLLLSVCLHSLAKYHINSVVFRRLHVHLARDCWCAVVLVMIGIPHSDIPTEFVLVSQILLSGVQG